MLRFNSTLLVFAIFMSLPCVARAQLVIPIPVVSGTLELYQSVLAEKQRSADEVVELRSENSTRGVAALVIIKQALHAGGLPVEFQFIEVPNAARERIMVQSGAAVISGEDLFSIAFADDVFMSSPVIPKGSFLKGVYCRSNNKDLLKISNLSELRNFTAVSYSEWKVDWLTLQGLGLKGLRDVSKHQTMFKLIQYRDIDFTLYEFPARGDLTQVVDGIELVPVPNVKVALKDSRHFMVSKLHPDGPRVFEALEKGLAILHEKGIIEQYFTDVGFYNPIVDGWKVLNP